MPYGREIWLRHVKYACGRVGDLFHFTSNKAVGGVRYFTIYEEIISHSASPNISLERIKFLWYNVVEKGGALYVRI